jgi:two-component system, OmpR family, sensor histidine kinase KdpD
VTGAPLPAPPRITEPAGGYLRAILVVAAAALVALPLRPVLNTIDVAMWFLLAVVVSATRLPRGPAVAASLLAILAFDVLFVPPYYRLTVEDTDYLLTFAVMLIVALVMSTITGRLRDQRAAAAWGEWQAQTRMEIQSGLGRAGTPAEVLETLRARISELLGVPGRVVYPLGAAADGRPEFPTEVDLPDTELRVTAAWALEHRRPAGWGAAQGGEAGALLLPVVPASGGAALLVFPEAPDRTPEPQVIEVAQELAVQGALALERAELTDRHEGARLEVAAEQLRTALLSSLSHDLRTPLAAIEGAATSLLEGSARLSSDDRRELATGILSESRRMHRLVGNLLDMVRVESGTLALHREWQPLEDSLGVAILRLEERLAGREVISALPEGLPLVWIDDVLLEQVFVNLLENATRHTPRGTRITITASATPQDVMVEVADTGPGLPAGSEELVFRKFYQVRTADAPATGGAGLGLAICRGIIQAHGGRIWAEPRMGGGTCFRFTLPLGSGPPPAHPVELDEHGG